MIEVLLHTMRFEAPGVVSLELAAPALPRFTPGAHIDLHLPNGMVRSYSLLPPRPGAEARYRIAVLNAPNGRGGSACVHESLRVGQLLSISAPRNNFPCDLSAANSVLLAGGIGITPLYAMAKALLVVGREVELIYCARSRTQAAFLDELSNLHGLRLSLRFDDEHAGPPDLTVLLAGRDPATRFYACGPAPMLAAFEESCAMLGYKHATLERFAPPMQAPSGGNGFTVVLQRTGKTLEIPEDSSIIDTLLAAGIDCDYSCGEGHCGACETKVLGGTPEHRDFVLTAAERAGNTKMMICVSRCADGKLVLDL